MCDGRRIDVKVALTKSQSLSSLKSEKHRKLYITGIPKGATKEDFEDYFTQFGRISDIRILWQGQSYRHKLFGFITFAEKTGADNALAFGEAHFVPQIDHEVLFWFSTPPYANKIRSSYAPRCYGKN
jgi:hypothetical protein